MARHRASTVSFDAIAIEGAFLSTDMLARIAAAGAEEQKEADYDTPPGLKLRDEIGRYYRIGEALWATFDRVRERDHGGLATTNFVTQLLVKVFGFSTLVPSEPLTIAGRIFPARYFALDGRVPIAIAPAPDGIDKGLPQFGDSHRRRSATLLLQELLNASDDRMFGLVTDGNMLRLMRDNASMTRPAWVEADLERIFGHGLFADFSALWLVIHQSRFGKIGSPPSDCVLERWREKGREQGVAARERLGEGVEAALKILGEGFLQHRDNAALVRVLETGELDAHAYFQELLRTVYRFIFLFTAEDRGLLRPKDQAETTEAKLYAEGYSVARLRTKTVRSLARDRHYDLWDGVRVVFRGLAHGEKRLALPALGGLFALDRIPHLDAAHIENRHLLAAIDDLAWLRDEGARVRINWRDMETEELGSVYESLLELTPRASASEKTFGFAEGAEAKGHARKTSGSYYTPDSLVQLLLDSALDPVVNETMARNPGREADALLELKVIDPAVGSGHFLLAAARRLAARIAQFRSPSSPSAEDYRHALRVVARHCLYGVDRNPMAVELCKVAIWIETVEPGKPLGFLDANIRCGDSLLGLFDLEALRQGIPDAAYDPLSGDERETARHFKARNRAERSGQGALDYAGCSGGLPASPPLASAARALHGLPEDSVEEIVEKRRRFEAAKANPKSWSWRVAADLYVAAFLMQKSGGVPANRNTVTVPTTGHVWQALSGGQVYGPLVDRAQSLATEACAFHWPLEFPDVMAAGGFDVVLGNPPWERIKLQEQEFFAAREPEIAKAANAAARGRMIAALKSAEPGTRERALFEEFETAKRITEASSVFARIPGEEGGRFGLTGHGDVNTYALFAELFANLASPRGRAGVIVPTGIATDATTAPFFAAMIDGRRLARLVDFENRERIFPAIDSRIKFCLLTLGREVKDANFAFFLTDAAQLAEPERRFSLSPAEIARINPNTKTAPVFRARADVELTAKIYARVPVLIDEATGPKGNPWGAEFHSRIWHMAEDSQWFRTAAQLRAAGFVPDGTDWVLSEGLTPRQRALDLAGGCDALSLAVDGSAHRQLERYVPLYEAKMIHQFDHRWATYDGIDSRDVTFAEKADSGFEPTPRYWVPESEVTVRLAAKGWTRGWLMGWRDICRSTDERTVIFGLMPRAAVGNTFPLIFVDATPRFGAALLANLDSLTLDFVARQKVGGTHLTYGYLHQFPVLQPSFYADSDLAFIIPRVLELTCTSHAMAPFARDLGYEGKPLTWDEDRRAQLRAELDAFYARAYGLSRDELRYILDPADVKGPDYPSETFRVLKTNEIRHFGEYRTARLVMQAWDVLAAKEKVA
jgi:hypothetical protein